MPAIYAITFPTVSYFYIGQTIDIGERRADHFRRLKKGMHPNPKLQAVFNKWGMPEFHIIEECEEEELDEREQFYLDLLFNNPHCTNICPTASAPNRGRKLGPWTEERRAKTIASLTGKKRSAMSRAKISAARSKPIIQWTREGHKVKEWVSATEAAKVIGVDKSCITACCKGQIKSSAGFIWTYSL